MCDQKVLNYNNCIFNEPFFYNLVTPAASSALVIMLPKNHFPFSLKRKSSSNNLIPLNMVLLLMLTKNINLNENDTECFFCFTKLYRNKLTTSTALYRDTYKMTLPIQLSIKIPRPNIKRKSNFINSFHRRYIFVLDLSRIEIFFPIVVVHIF